MLQDVLSNKFVISDVAVNLCDEGKLLHLQKYRRDYDAQADDGVVS